MLSGPDRRGEMEEKDALDAFLDGMIGARIAMAAGEKGAGEREMALMRENALVLDGLDQQMRQRIETRMNLMIDEMIGSERKSYMEGLKDGIKLMKWMQGL